MRTCTYKKHQRQRIAQSTGSARVHTSAPHRGQNTRSRDPHGGSGVSLFFFESVRRRVVVRGEQPRLATALRDM